MQFSHRNPQLTYIHSTPSTPTIKFIFKISSTCIQQPPNRILCIHTQTKQIIASSESCDFESMVERNKNMIPRLGSEKTYNCLPFSLSTSLLIERTKKKNKNTIFINWFEKDPKTWVKKKIKNKDDLKQMHALQNIEEGIEDMKCLKLAMCFIWKHSYVF